jgi:hypothetical protein
MNAMSLPEEEARALGVPTGPLRAAVVAAATLVTAASVSAAGVIGWVGLVVPHLARFLVGPSFPRLMPAAAILGGGYLLLIDTLARSLAPVEIPLGILTAVIGTPFFIALLRQARARTMPVKSPSRRVTPALSIATSPDASERSERGAADNQEALYCWGGPGRMGEIGRERLLCGHTHGGQICLPGGIPVMTDADSPRALARGAWRYHDMAGYTSAGTGTCIVDVRLNCPSASARRAGPEHAAILSGRQETGESRRCRHQHHPCRFSRRVELHDPTQQPFKDIG